MGPPNPSSLSPHVRRLLAGLRWRIRAYVWLEGLSLAIVWLGATYWIGLAIDYGLVRLGSDELPRGVRLTLLAAIAAVLGFILYRYVVRRSFTPLGDRSMALLLERRYGQLHDSLLTAVELDDAPERAAIFNREMLSATQAEAEQAAQQVRLSSIFNFAPLLRAVGGAIVVIVFTVVLFGWQQEAMGIWANRLYALSDEPWPRRAHIEVLEAQVTAGQTSLDATPIVQNLPLTERRIKVARGSNIRLLVQAEAVGRVVPETCTIYYRTTDGDRGRVNMKKVGDARQGHQLYTFDEKPLREVLSALSFEVLGYDHRVRGFQIDVVDSPVLVGAELDCTFPAYLVDERLSLWLPRTETYRTGLQLPRGAAVVIRARVNKPLEEVVATLADSGQQVSSPVSGSDRDGFEIRLPQLLADTTIELAFRDADGVVNQSPQRLVLLAMEDQPPRIDSRLAGIGSAITPDARIPLTGKVTDDYGVAEAWFELETGDGDALRRPIRLAAEDKFEAALDLREERSRAEEDRFELRPQQKVFISVKANDRYDLGPEENVGVGDRYQLDVVTPDELLSQLEGRELGLRRRFEQIIVEVTEMRDSLVRVQDDGGSARLLVDPDDRGEAPTIDPVEIARREAELRRLRVERAQTQSAKSSQEVLGVGLGFFAIRDELVNNRIDTQERRERIEQLIAQPLETIARERFPEFDARLAGLQAALAGAEESRAAAAAVVVDDANRLLAELEEVLERMLDLETFNELIDIVRSLIKEQEELIDATKKQQKSQILDLLE